MPGAALFAADGGGETAGLMLLASLLGGGVTWLANWFAQRRDKGRADRLADDQTAVSRYKELYDRLGAELAQVKKESRAEVHELRGRCNVVELRLARAETWITMLEEILEREHVPHRKWAAIRPSDTDIHDALQGGDGDGS